MASGCGLTGLFSLYGLALMIRSFGDDSNSNSSVESVFNGGKTISMDDRDFAGMSR